MDANCIFCKIASKQIPAKLLYEDDAVVAFDDLNPQAPVHALIITKKHVAAVNGLEGDDTLLAGKILLAAKKVAKELGVAESGYRIVFNCNRDAGQDIFHIHAHLLGGRKFSWPPG